MVDLLGIISFFLLSLVVRKLVVGYLKDTNAGEWCHLRFYELPKYLAPDQRLDWRWQLHLGSHFHPKKSWQMLRVP